jgi:hypothetical protein
MKQATKTIVRRRLALNWLLLLAMYDPGPTHSQRRGRLAAIMVRDSPESCSRIVLPSQPREKFRALRQLVAMRPSASKSVPTRWNTQTGLGLEGQTWWAIQTSSVRSNQFLADEWAENY